MLDRLESEAFDVARRRRRDHRNGRRPRRRIAGPAHRPGRARRLRVRYVVEELQARPRWPALPPTGRDPPRLRSAPRAPAAAPERAPPRAGAAVHDPDPHQGRCHLAQDRPSARLGDVDVRPHRWPADRQAPPAAQDGRGASPTCRRCRPNAWQRLPVLRRHRRRCPAHASRWRERPPHTGRSVVNRCGSSS